jgi:hypothetical protein
MQQLGQSHQLAQLNGWFTLSYSEKKARIKIILRDCVKLRLQRV